MNLQAISLFLIENKNYRDIEAIKMTANELLNRIIKKGGVLGAVAKICVEDKNKANLYLKECADMCGSQMVKDLWGKELIADILKYEKMQDSKNKKVSEFSLLILKTVKNLRKQKGYKQDVIASSLDMTQSNYSKIEEGLRPITLDQLNAIATKLNLSVSEILYVSSKGKNH